MSHRNWLIRYTRINFDEPTSRQGYSKGGILNVNDVTSWSIYTGFDSQEDTPVSCRRLQKQLPAGLRRRRGPPGCNSSSGSSSSLGSNWPHLDGLRCSWAARTSAPLSPCAGPSCDSTGAQRTLKKEIRNWLELATSSLSSWIQLLGRIDDLRSSV